MTRALSLVSLLPFITLAIGLKLEGQRVKSSFMLPDAPKSMLLPQEYLDKHCGRFEQGASFQQVGFTKPVNSSLTGGKICLLSVAEDECARLEAENDGFWLASGYQATFYKYVYPHLFTIILCFRFCNVEERTYVDERHYRDEVCEEQLNKTIMGQSDKKFELGPGQTFKSYRASKN